MDDKCKGAEASEKGELLLHVDPNFIRRLTTERSEVRCRVWIVIAAYLYSL
jgi:hypothetical protein